MNHGIACSLSKLEIRLEYQIVANPAYNKDRGPLDLDTIRAHVKILNQEFLCKFDVPNLGFDSQIRNNTKF